VPGDTNRHARRKIDARRDRLRGVRPAVVERDAQHAAPFRRRAAIDERRGAHDVNIDDVQRAIGRECDAERIRRVRVLSEVGDVDTGKCATRDRPAVIVHPRNGWIPDHRADRPAPARRVARDREWKRQVREGALDKGRDAEPATRVEPVGPAVACRSR